MTKGWHNRLNKIVGSLKVLKGELSHPVLSTKINQSQSCPYVGEMIHICRQNETCRRNVYKLTKL